MKNIINVSILLVLLLSTAVFAAKPKKSAAEPKKAIVETNKPAIEPNKPIIVEPNKPAEEPNVSEANSVKDVNNQAIAVTVNGTAITEAQIETIVGMRMQQMASRVPENMVPQYRLQVRKYVIEQLVIEELIAQEEKRNNITVSEANVTEQINKQVSGQNLTIDEFKALLKAYGTTFSDYQQNMRKRLMFDKLMEVQFSSKLQIPTDEQAKTYYDDNIQQFHKPDAIHVRHILIKVDSGDSNDPNRAKAQARAKVQDILKKLQGGADFNDLAKQYSACPSSKDGGDLGIQPKGRLVPEFEKAAYALKPGQLSDIVETEFGYHIIKLIEHIDANTASFGQVKDEIKQVLTDKQKEQTVMDYIRQLRSGANIKFTNEADKVEFEISGTKPAPTRKEAGNTRSSDVNKPASKDTGESKKE